MRPAKHLLVLLLALPAATLLLSAEENPFLRNYLKQDNTDRAPALDPKRVINESSSFLKAREPEMTASEYALYEKVVSMLTVQPEFAVTLLEGMISEKEKPSPAFNFILGNAYYSVKKTAKAEACYLDALARYPDFLRAWNNLAVLYYAEGRHADAARCFSKAVTLGDHAPNTYGLLGYCLERQGNHVGAEAAYLQALAGDITQTDWTEGLMRLYLVGKQYARAESLAHQLLQARPREARFWLTYANILLGQGRKFEAIAVLDSAVTLGVADTQSRLMLGDLYTEKQLVPEAIAAYASVREDERTLGVQRLVRLGQMLTGSRDYERARETLEKTVRIASPAALPEVNLARAELALAQGDFKAAKPLLEALVEGSPLNGRALLALARTQAGLGDPVRASILFEHATQIPDSAHAACLELANLELRLQHYERCLNFAEKALALERSSAVEQFIAHIRTLIAPKS